MELTNAYVRIHSGVTAQGNTVENVVVKLVQHISRDAATGKTYITVDALGQEGFRRGRGGNSRVFLTSADYEMVDAKEVPSSGDFGNTDIDSRSDEEIERDLHETFEILAEMTSAAATGIVKGLVVSGPAGIGKSHTVEETLINTSGVVCKLMERAPNFEVVKGRLTAIMLYCTLYRYREAGSVLVLDDADGILYDEDSLNLLKAVLDTKKVRRVHWGSNSHILEKEGVPANFEFAGSIIFLTNLNWENTRSERISNHLQAIMSRAHYINLNINTAREKRILVKHTAKTTNILDGYHFTGDDIDEILEWMEMNNDSLQTVDLRTFIKAADMKLAMKDNWKKYASRSLFKRGF